MRGAIMPAIVTSLLKASVIKSRTYKEPTVRAATDSQNKAGKKHHSRG